MQLHSSASHRHVAHERGAGHDLQRQNCPFPCSEQCGSPPPSVRSKALQTTTRIWECAASYHRCYPDTIISFNCDSPVAAWTHLYHNGNDNSKAFESKLLYSTWEWKTCAFLQTMPFFFPSSFSPFSLTLSCFFHISSELSTTYLVPHWTCSCQISLPVLTLLLAAKFCPWVFRLPTWLSCCSVFVGVNLWYCPERSKISTHWH